eukprot:5949645-Pyramimonas_sp.AAC.1
MPVHCAAQLSSSFRRSRGRASFGARVAVAHACHLIPRADWAPSDRREGGRRDQGHRAGQHRRAETSPGRLGLRPRFVGPCISDNVERQPPH